MKKVQGVHLLVLLLLTPAEGELVRSYLKPKTVSPSIKFEAKLKNTLKNVITVLLGKETRAKNERKSFTLPEDKIPRSALIGIKPEDMEKTEQTGQSKTTKRLH